MLYPTPARLPHTAAARLAPLLLLLLVPAARAEAPADLAALRQSALRSERAGQWQDACRWYDEILRKDRASADARRGYQRCLRRLHLARRHADQGYHDSLGRLDARQALDVYEQVLNAVAATYIDRRKTTYSALFRHGLQELRFALQERAFLAAFLPGVAPDAPALKALQARLADWPAVKLADSAEAREQVLAVVAAAREVGLRPGPDLVKAVGLEFAAGACNALDEYTLFLTPGRYGEAHAELSGRLVSVGVEVAANAEGRLEISRVYPRSPAHEAGLQKHDRLLEIDGKNVERASADAVMDRLRGKPDEPVRLTVLPAPERMPMGPTTVTLRRRPVVVPSVEYSLDTVTHPEFGPVPVGVIRIGSFQEATPQEVREAIAVLRTGTMTTPGMRGLVLDLRGNPGGLFKSAVEVAELFLHEGVVAVTHSHFPDYNQPYRARSMHPLELPVVVLIDGDTASAAEVVAGALKELRRATLIGQTTFGKGTIQCLVALNKVPLDKMPAGIRITVARFCSPSDQPVNGRGVAPDVVSALEGKALLEQAESALLGLIFPMTPMPPMPMPMAMAGMPR